MGLHGMHLLHKETRLRLDGWDERYIMLFPCTISYHILTNFITTDEEL
jgi:hypothetical protein